MKENTIVRENLMTVQGYTPYCGDDYCNKGLSRTKWDDVKEQFICSCGWVSSYPYDFIIRYKQKWNIGLALDKTKM